MSEPRPTVAVSQKGGGPNLLECGGVVVGYALAATLARAVAPGLITPERFDPLLRPVVLGVYLWLGLAMAGPFVMLTGSLSRGRGRSDRRAEATPPLPPETAWSRGETAWVLVGAYWLAMTLLVAPRRLPEMVWLGLVPSLVLIALGCLPSPGRSRPSRTLGTEPDPPAARWTCGAALVVMAAWPWTWLGLILLGLGREWFG